MSETTDDNSPEIILDPDKHDANTGHKPTDRLTPINKNVQKLHHQAERYEDVDQRRQILSVRGGILQILTEELAEEMVYDDKLCNKKLRLPKARALVKAAIESFMMGDTKQFEVITKTAGLLDTALLEMNFITDQRKIVSNEIINLGHLSQDEQVKFADMLTKVQADSFDAVDKKLEVFEESGKDITPLFVVSEELE